MNLWGQLLVCTKQGWEGTGWQKSAHLLLPANEGCAVRTSLLCSPAALWSKRFKKMTWCFKWARNHWSNKSAVISGINCISSHPAIFNHQYFPSTLNLKPMLAHRCQEEWFPCWWGTVSEDAYRNACIILRVVRKGHSLLTAFILLITNFTHFLINRRRASSRIFLHCEYFPRTTPLQNNPSKKLHFINLHMCLP